MKDKRKKQLIIAGSILIVLLMIGASYAYWSITHTQTNTNVVHTGCFNISFTSGSGITMNNALPIKDAEGKTTTPYHFTITNTCNSPASYQINLERLDTSTLASEYVKAVLNKQGPRLLTKYDEVETTISTATNSYKLYKGTLQPLQTKEYDLRIWMDYATTTIQGSNKTFDSKIVVIAVPKIEQKPLELAWNKNFGGTSNDYFSSVVQTSDGGYIAVGESNSTNGDLAGLNIGMLDAIIVKYDSSGNILWNKNFGGTSNDYFRFVQVTSDGGYIAIGVSYSTDGNLTGLNKGGQDAIIVKYDSSGNVLWNKNFGGSGNDSFAIVQTTSDGGYIAAGTSSSVDDNLTGLNKGSNDAIVVKYDSSGNVEWNKNFGGTNSDSYNYVALTLDGGYIAVGDSYSINGDLVGLNKGDRDAIIVKYDSSGNVEWNKNFGGSGGDYFVSAQGAGDGGFIAVGESFSNDGNLTGLNKGGYDAIIVKYDSSGNIEWNKNFGGSDIDCFTVGTLLPDDEYIVVGYSGSTNDDLTGLNKGLVDAIIVKYDDNGNMLWNKNFGGSGIDYFNGGALLPDGGYVALGESYSTDGDLNGLNKGSIDAIIVYYK